MSEPQPAPPRAAVRCRPIENRDLDAVVALLARGFADRTEDYWRRGLARHATRPLPEGCPTYGTMLESQGRPVGVLLTLFDAHPRDGGAALRCNLSSWYVEPEFLAQAAMLDASAQRRRDATYLNVSPAPHTVALQEARGFTRYCRGQMFIVPALSPGRRGLRARVVSSEDPLDDLPPAERRLVRDHLSYGCIGVVATEAGLSQPLVFLKRRIGWSRRDIGSGPVPCLQLVFCRDVAALPRLAGPVGRRLLVHCGIPWMVVDAAGPMPGLVGRYFEGRAPKYCRGPAPARLGDLAYTELVIFGP